MSAHEHVDGQLPHEPERATLEGRNKVLGFWIFLGAETVLFGTLFSAFLALRHNIGDGPAASHLFELPMVFAATMILLFSSLTSVFAVQAMHSNKVKPMIVWLAITILLGLAFLCLEIYEFNTYVSEGHQFRTSAFSSSFYTLVGFHGAHVAFGVLWIGLLIAQIFKKGLTVVTAPKIYVSAIYWHFIDVVWVFIFTVVYLMGKVG
ncbi:cytochrome (ubi)quinol oxidase subunit III [Cohnella faecalis]|uniref:Cytochrome (Ubi)quinol oxidase subunit III n=1 Tax=Cohnella faecalis TaxID=2315694 RepID=A0A398CIM2_9BACL|nr:cytochrome (ubi)quinol oxidase subunit III [Cohnella faecalis]RIE02230.1 cytochrome (ubi)quinol oxidase subunit III [Cohnella faecalis]